MKRAVTTPYIFDASQRKLTLSSIFQFDVKKLYAVINITRNQIIYVVGNPTYGLTSLSGSELTLVFDTTSHADTDELMVLYDDRLLEIPSDDTDGDPIPVRALPQHLTRIGFARAVDNGIDAAWGALVRSIGSGMGVNQTGGNLVITSGVTARSETIIRSNASWKGGIRLRARTTLSQRIANQNFFVELVDVIGDGLSYNITSATAIVVTIPNNPFTADNVGQSVHIGGFVGTGTFLSGRYPIASVSGDNVTFTVSGFAVGSGTCSVFGWNYYQVLYNGTSATTALFQTQRRGYANAAISATISSTLSPGHLAVVTGNDLMATFADQLTASATAIQQTIRATQVENVPDDANLRVQIRVLNGSTAPASTTTWTIGFIAVSNFALQDVSIQDLRPMSNASGLPVEILRAVALSITGNVNVAVQGGTNRGLFVGGAGIWFDDSSTALGANATFTGSSRDHTVTATATAWANAATYGQELVVSAESDVAGTLWLEVSRDNTNWRRVKSIATSAVAGGGQYAEIVHRPSWRYSRVGYSNGAGAQTRFTINSFLKAV
jgi:hypothetical protein